MFFKEKYIYMTANMEENEKLLSDTTPELCVLCGKETGYLFNTPISERFFYIPGAGQLCEECFKKTYGRFGSENS